MTQTDSTVLTMLPPDADESLQLAWAIAAAADERKAENIVLLKVATVSYLADYFVLCTGFSRVQVRAISDSIEALVKEQLGRSPLRTEGRGENSWILQDYGEVIAHSLLPTERDFYNLEAFWGHAERIEFQTPPSL